MNKKGQKRAKSLIFLAILSGFTMLGESVSYADEDIVPSNSNVVALPNTPAATASGAIVPAAKKKGAKMKSKQVAAAPSNPNQPVTTNTATETTEQPTYAKDPLEGFNRAMFTFNDKLDTYFMKPVATLYNAVMPKPLNRGIHNFFNNLGELPTIANDILQLNFFQMTNDTWRLVVNSTLGIGGLFDMASRMGMPYYANDFGLTLARWGYADSTYLVLPFFGPSTIRDGIGIPVDYYGFSAYNYIRPDSVSYQLYALGVVDRRAQLLQFQPVFEEVALNKYVFTRNAYMQRRNYQIEQNRNLGYANKNKVNTTQQPANAS